MRIIKFIKLIINFKFFFKKPTKKKILVYDRASEKFAEILFKKKDYSFYDVRYESINFYVIFNTIFKSGLREIRTNYKINYFRFVSPKIIYTCIDNNIGFFKLKNIYPNALYISDQNGMRNNVFYYQCKEYLKKNNNLALKVDIFFCFGLNEKKRISKVIKAKVYPLGNTLNNNFTIIKSKSKKKLDKVMYISQDPKVRFNLEKSILEKLFEICEENNLKIYFLDRRGQNNKKFIEKFFKKKFNYVSNNSKYLQGYKELSPDYIYINGHSTLGYELLSKNYKCLSFNHTYYLHGVRKVYKKTGPFWSGNKNKKKMRSLILKTIKISSKEWNRKIKRYQNELMIYDKFNKN